jgi:uncharacterized protein (TIGR02246 family)
MPDDDALQQLLDIEEIKTLKARYCRFYQAKDWQAWGDLFVDDVYIENDGGVLEGRDRVVRYNSTVLSHATVVLEVNTPEITITGPDSATAIWPVHAYTIMGDADEFRSHGYGAYEEEYRRTAHGWRIARSVETRTRVDTEGELPASILELLRNA